MFASQARSTSLKMALNLLGRLRFTTNQRLHSESTSGLTLIECLVAIIIVSLTILAITPPILLATGTRVQSRRAEQANHVAQSEVDRLRLLVERGAYATTDLPNTASGGSVNSNIGTAGPATSVGSLLASPSSCNTYPGTSAVAWNSLVLVDVDGDCTPEFVMQVFRNAGQTPTGETAPYSFDVGVRVYTYYQGQPLPTLQTDRASLIAGTNNRDAQAGNARKPLAVLYSRLSRNDQSKALGSICQQAKASSGSTATCNF